MRYLLTLLLVVGCASGEFDSIDKHDDLYPHDTPAQQEHDLENFLGEAEEQIKEPEPEPPLRRLSKRLKPKSCSSYTKRERSKAAYRAKCGKRKKK